MCDDQVDNDEDGLADCLDPDCCASQHCRELANSKDPAVEDAKQACAHSDSFQFRLLITQMAQAGSTFYGQLEFLLRHDGVMADNFDPRRISVVRGTVRQWDGTAFWGVRVLDSLKMHNGYTLTDELGRFDLPVEGGSTVKLEFLRHPTSRFSATCSVYVPVNEIVVLGDFYMQDSQLVGSQSTTRDTQGGHLASSPLMHDLWATGQFMSDEQQPDTCKASETHVLTASGSLLVEVDSVADTLEPVCMDWDERLCVRRGALSYAIPLHDTRIRLVYRSDRAAGYQPIVRVRLLTDSATIPEGLREIHLIFDVAGLRHTRRLEPELRMVEIFRWNKTDGYNRTVYGIVNARVSAGYVYSGCDHVIWEHRVVQLQGYELASSELANWNLDVVHVYAANQGIVYRGDGSHLFLKYTDWRVTPVLGQTEDGARRSPDSCPHCASNQLARGSPTLHLHSLLTDAAGDLLVGDGSYLRWIRPPRLSKTRRSSATESLDARAQLIFKENDRQTWLSHNVSKLDFLRTDLDQLAFHGSSEQVYTFAHPNLLLSQSIFDSPSDIHGIQSGFFLSHTSTKTIWWFADLNHPQLLLSVECTEQPDSPPLLTTVHCVKHPLQAPKGIAATESVVYFADGPFIWRLPLRTSTSANPVAHVAVGQAVEPTTSDPISCNHAVSATQIILHSPTHLVYNALEDAVYFADRIHVYRYHVASQTVSIVAGQLKDCVLVTTIHQDASVAALDAILTEIRGLAVSPEGDLYIAEHDRIWMRRANGRLYPVAGKRQSSGNSDSVPPATNPSAPTRRSSASHKVDAVDLGTSQDFLFGNISAIAVSIYGELFVSDAEHGLVHRIHYRLPPITEPSSTYRITSAPTDETHVFNQYGQLMHTENAITKTTLHQLEYRPHAIFGWLSEIRGNNVNLRLRVQRDTQGNSMNLRTPTGSVYNITLSSGSPQLITQIGDPRTGGSWLFRYHHSGLLTQVQEPHETHPIHFKYSPGSGRLKRIVFPSGHVVNLNSLCFDTSGAPDPVSAYPGVINSTLSSQLSTGFPTVVSREHARTDTRSVELFYGEPHDRWSAQLVHSYQFRGDSNRPARIVRVIQLPDRTRGRILENSVVWNFDWNADSVASSSFGPTSTRLRRSAAALVLHSPQSRRIRHFPFSHLSSTLLSSSFNPTTAVLGMRWQHQKRLVVNAHELLQVKFDWARQLETYRRTSTGHVLLQIVYNADFQPMIFNATRLYDTRWYDFRVDMERADSADSGVGIDQELTGPSPLSVTYTGTGQINTIHWGGASYRFSYDPLNRLRATDLGSPTESISFQYLDHRVPYLPTIVSVSGLGQYKFFYSHGAFKDGSSQSLGAENAVNPVGLARVLTPSGLSREFVRSVGLGVHRLMYTPWSGVPNPWIFEWGNDLLPSNPDCAHVFGNELLRFIWPSQHRRVSHFPRLNRIVFDKTIIHWDLSGMEYAPQFNDLSSAPFVQMTDITSGYRCTTWRTYHGTLLSTIRIEQSVPGARNAHPSLGGLLHARFVYEYNANLNLVGIHTQLYTELGLNDSGRDSRVLDEMTMIKRDPITGQVLSIRELDVVHRPSSLYVTYAPKGLQLLRQWDNQGRLRQAILYTLSSRRDPLYNLSLIYRPNSLDVVQQREEQRGHVPRWVTFVQGVGGRLEAVDREEAGSSLRSHTELVHNPEGRVARLRIAISDPQLAATGLSNSGPTSRSEELQFIYDTRGLLKRRGNWEYVFDEDGFLSERRLHEDHIVDRFAYNSKGLLIWAERTMDPESPTDSPEPLVTVFDRPPVEDDVGSNRPFRVQYIYDAQDRLTIIRDTLLVRDLAQYFYADPGHPNRITHVFNHGRLTTFRLHYDPVQGHLIAMEEFAAIEDPHASSDRPLMSDRSNHDTKYANKPLSDATPKYLYFIITNQEGSPIAVISEDGKTIWTAEYSATGGRRLTPPNRAKLFRTSIVEDANVPLGYAGCLVDAHTAFLFCPPQMRAYDPLGATFTSPDWRGLLTHRLGHVYRDPSSLDTHKWGTTEQHFLRLGPVGLADRLSEALQSSAWWLRQTGLDLQSIVPPFDPCTGTIGFDANLQWKFPKLPASFASSAEPSDSSPHRNCPFSSLTSKLERLSVVQPSRLTPGNSHGTSLPEILSYGAIEQSFHLIPAEHMFGSKVSFELDNQGRVNVRADAASVSNITVSSLQSIPYDEAFRSSRLPIALLNGARLLDWWTERDASGSAVRLVQLFARLSHVALTVNELADLGLKLPILYSPTGHNLTVHRIEQHHEIWVTRGSIQWRIRYVSSWDGAYSQAIREAGARGRRAAWARESDKAHRLSKPERVASSTDRLVDSNVAAQLLGLNHLWTFKELAQLGQSTPPKGYQWVPVVSAFGNWTTITRLYDDPGIYQLRPTEAAKTKRTSG